MTGCAPPKRTLCPPSENCAPKKFTGSGLLECKSRPKTPKLVFTVLELASRNCFFRNFCGLTPDFIKLFGRRPFFFLVFTSEFVKNCKNFKTTTRMSGIFCSEDLFYWSSLFSFDPHSNKLLVLPCPPPIHINKLLVPSQNLFLSPSHAILAPGLF